MQLGADEQDLVEILCFFIFIEGFPRLAVFLFYKTNRIDFVNGSGQRFMCAVIQRVRFTSFFQ